ncbi:MULTISPECIES: hypothetical protein [Caballeronia]|jgi:hypothetical protein|uniref:Lipoprotein n=1 Tax=Caballeronia telluris TaxID=326475 RepID=A0A158HNI8_9BURK|nr:MULTISPECIES: hypothetical protein [Caballeronia]MDR5751099.1 hypothetical protein [Caballeronia sp. LZ024]MDR5844764.1 hypothetical protein [Caballeronia sp. LZ031]SAL45972.1 lipoprotein [Caballeronia telluris]
MLRIVLFAAVSLVLCACADSSTQPKHRPPQDPPDYKGVPTDTRPPVMLIAPDKSE